MRITARALPMPGSPLHDGIEPLLIFPTGNPPSNDDRKWLFTRADLEMVVAEFATRTEPLQIDYAHGTDPAKGKKAAGWVDRLELRDDGLYGSVRWTPTAKAEINDGEWGFRSPEFDAVDENGFVRPRALHRVGLVNDPAIGGMPAVRASTQTEVPVAKKQGSLEILTAVRDALGLDATASVKEITTAFAQCVDGAAMEDAPEEEAPPAAEAIPPIVPAAVQTSQLSEGDRVKAELATGEKVERIAASIKAATKDGRITAASKDHAIRLATLDPDAFTAFLGTLPTAAPNSGTLVTAQAGDRKAGNVSFAERIRTARNAAMGGA